MFLCPLFVCLLVSCLALPEISVIQTAKETGDRLTPKASIPFVPHVNNSLPQIILDPATKYQQILGFGAAFTDSVAAVFSGLSPAFQEQVLNSYFGPDGLQYNLCRLTIGSCDFSVGTYSYAETAEDYTMKNFSIAHDLEKIIPMIKRAQKTREWGDQLMFFASPWSPPAWMKQNGHMRNSNKPGLIQKPEIFLSYALYLSKYVSAYANQGIPIWGITVQNEPHVADQFLITYECCGFTAENESDFLANYLGPRMKQDHPNLKILIHDDQKPEIVDFVSTIMNNSRAAQYVWGAAFHWYGGFLQNYQYLHQLHEKYPNLPLLATEATLEAHWKQWDDWAQGQYYAIDIIGDLNNWAIGWVDWNMLLNFEGGPEHSWGPCDAPISASFEYWSLEYRPSFFHFGHFTKYLPRGSTRIGNKGVDTGTLQYTTFLSPKKEIVVVVLNVGLADFTFQLVFKEMSAVITIPSNGIQSLIFPLL